MIELPYGRVPYPLVLEHEGLALDAERIDDPHDAVNDASVRAGIPPGLARRTSREIVSSVARSLVDSARSANERHDGNVLVLPRSDQLCELP